MDLDFYNGQEEIHGGESNVYGDYSFGGAMYDLTESAYPVRIVDGGEGKPFLQKKDDDTDTTDTDESTSDSTSSSEDESMPTPNQQTQSALEPKLEPDLDQHETSQETEPIEFDAKPPSTEEKLHTGKQDESSSSESSSDDSSSESDEEPNQVVKKKRVGGSSKRKDNVKLDAKELKESSKPLPVVGKTRPPEKNSKNTELKSETDSDSEDSETDSGTDSETDSESEDSDIESESDDKDFIDLNEPEPERDEFSGGYIENLTSAVDDLLK